MAQIAHTLGLTESGACKARRRFKLPPRQQGWQPPAKPVAVVVTAPKIEDMLKGDMRARFLALRDEMGLSEREALRRLYAAVAAE